MPKIKKEIKENNEEKTEEKPSKSKSDKQLYWVFGAMIAIIAIFLIAVSFKSDANTIKYEGLKFQKERIGNIPIYKYSYLTNKIVRTTGNVIRTDDQTAVTIYLRNDPNKLDVPVNGKIEYAPKEQFIYLTVDPNGVLCEYSPIAMATLGTFLHQNGFVVRAGSSDEQDAQANNLTYITCENRPDRMVLSLQAGEKNEIVRDGNCYRIKIANCDILPPVEKFVVQSILDARETEQN